MSKFGHAIDALMCYRDMARMYSVDVLNETQLMLLEMVYWNSGEEPCTIQSLLRERRLEPVDTILPRIEELERREFIVLMVSPENSDKFLFLTPKAIHYLSKLGQIMLCLKPRGGELDLFE